MSSFKHGVEKAWGPDQITVDASPALYHLAVCGAGLATLPDFIIDEAIAAGRFAEMLPSPGVYVLWPRDAARTGLTLKLVKYLAGTQ